MSRKKKLRVLPGAPTPPASPSTPTPSAPEGVELIELSPIEAAHADRAEETALTHAGKLFAHEMQTLARVRASSDQRFANGHARVMRYPDGRWFFQILKPAKESLAAPDAPKEGTS
jgi:hypothetical protein